MVVTTTKLVNDHVPIEKRYNRSRYFKREYPDSIPIFVQYKYNIHRYLVPRDNNFGHLLIAFRRKLSLKSSMGLISLIEKQDEDNSDVVKSYQLATSQTIGELSERYLSDDGFLYINITTENVFGA